MSGRFCFRTFIKSRNRCKNTSIRSTCVRGTQTILPPNVTEGWPILPILNGVPPRPEGRTRSMQRVHVASYFCHTGSSKHPNPAPRARSANTFSLSEKHIVPRQIFIKKILTFFAKLEWLEKKKVRLNGSQRESTGVRATGVR